tara:strand:+ start:291 stop:968 length:678 start_codon:yes stop_codon:yes gene_type:complete
MKNYFLILCALLVQNVFAQKQEEVIPSNEKAIIYIDSVETSTPIDTMIENEVFLITEYDASNSEWIMVDIPMNKMSKSKSGKIDFFKTGYVKKIDINLIDEFSKELEKNVRITFKIVKADTNKNIPIENLKYGLEIPLKDSYQITKMSIEWKGEIRLTDAVFYEDLYNVSFKEGELSSSDSKKFEMFQKGESFFIKHNCGDGAGSYEITWVIKDGNIVQRLVDTI